MNSLERSTQTDIESRNSPTNPRVVRKKRKVAIWLLAMIVLAMVGWLAVLGWGAIAFWQWMFDHTRI